MSEAANEFEAIKAVHAALEPLEADARNRVVTYIASLLSIDASTFVGRAGEADSDLDDEVEGDAEEINSPAPTYSEFAELYEAADPSSNGEKALAAGYWLQICQGADSFTGFEANKMLTDLGHRVGNITDAINTMKDRKPSLIMQ